MKYIDNADIPNLVLWSCSSMEIFEQNRSKASREVGDGDCQLFSYLVKDFQFVKDTDSREEDLRLSSPVKNEHVQVTGEGAVHL